MTVSQNECYRLVTIKYLKDLIGQNAAGTTSLIQNSTGGYVTIPSSIDEKLCPTYDQLIGYVGLRVENSSTPKNDKDGLIISKWHGDGTTPYSGTQCVDRHDVSIGYTRISGLQLSVDKHTFDGCGESGTSVNVSNTYIRKTKSMSGCAADEGSIVYTTAATEVSATCDSTFTFHKSLADSTISCTKYDIAKNTGSTERTDNVYVTVNFRGTDYPSNHEILTQPAGDGAYSEVISTRSAATEIRVTASPNDYKVRATCSDECEANVNSRISLTPVGVYDVWTTYAYKKCGVIDRTDTKEILTKTGQTTSTIPSVSLQWVTSGSCYGETAGQPIDVASTALTVTWSGLTVNRTFVATATTKHCESPTPVLECCQLNGPMTLSCSGTAEFKIGECGCQNMVDLGLPTGTKWGQYPLGTDENYNTFVYYQWGYTDKWTTASGNSHPRYSGAFDCVETGATNFDVDVDNCNPAEEHDAVKFNYPNSGYRMPTKDEAIELLSDTHTSKTWQTDYNGKGITGWLLTSRHNGNTLFIPAVGEFYPESDEAGKPWTDNTKNGNTYVWTRTGLYENYNNYNGYRIYASANGGDNIRVVDSSPRYGNIVMPVCDKG